MQITIIVEKSPARHDGLPIDVKSKASIIDEMLWSASSSGSLNPDAHWVESGKGTIEVSKTGDTAYMRYDVVVEKFMSLAGWLQMHNIRFRVENYDFSQLEESYMEKYMGKNIK